MELRKYKKCDKCKKEYDASYPFHMNEDKKPVDSEIEIYGKIYRLCPSCTYDLYHQITGNQIAEK